MTLFLLLVASWLGACAWSAWDHRLRQKREREHHEYLMAVQAYVRKSTAIAAELNMKCIRLQIDAAEGMIEAAKDEPDEPWKHS